MARASINRRACVVESGAPLVCSIVFRPSGSLQDLVHQSHGGQCLAHVLGADVRAIQMHVFVDRAVEDFDGTRETAKCSRSESARSSRRSMPSSSRWPDAGCRTPLSKSISVLLPEPDGPIRATYSPGLISKLTSCSTSCPWLSEAP